MRVGYLAIAGALAAGIAAWFVLNHSEKKTVQPRVYGPAPPTPGFQGVASCAASACHGNGQTGSRGGEWNTWARLDPHARSFEILLEDRSRQIERNLNPSTAEPRPERNELCLNCHVQPGIIQASRSPRFVFADGVGCESCHGPAGNWIHEHAQPGWQRSGDGNAGMKNTPDLAVRAEVCVTCHIGKGDIQVNHDLIAAGHPRLRFEFATYFARYPAHWSGEKDQKRYPDLEARAWIVGQAVSALAALNLLSHRARSKEGVWPELAEFDCYACHHDLAPRSWRQENPGPGSSPGKLVLNDWYYAALPAATKEIDPAPLASLMKQPNAERSRIAELADKQIRGLEKVKSGLSAKTLDRPARMALLGGLAQIERLPGPPSWDRDTQLYLGGVALTASKTDTDFRSPLAALHSVLHQAHQTGSGDWLVSPRGYEPNEVNRCWQEIREQLKKQAGPGAK